MAETIQSSEVLVENQIQEVIVVPHGGTERVNVLRGTTGNANQSDVMQPYKQGYDRALAAFIVWRDQIGMSSDQYKELAVKRNWKDFLKQFNDSNIALSFVGGADVDPEGKVTGAQVYADVVIQELVNWTVSLAMHIEMLNGLDPEQREVVNNMMNRKVQIIKAISANLFPNLEISDAVLSQEDLSLVTEITEEMQDLIKNHIFTDGSASLSTVGNAEQLAEQLQNRALTTSIKDITLISQRYHNFIGRLSGAYEKAFAGRNIKFLRTDQILDAEEQFVAGPITGKNFLVPLSLRNRLDKLIRIASLGISEIPHGKKMFIGGIPISLADEVLNRYVFGEQRDVFMKILSKQVEEQRQAKPASEIPVIKLRNGQELPDISLQQVLVLLCNSPIKNENGFAELSPISQQRIQAVAMLADRLAMLYLENGTMSLLEAFGKIMFVVAGGGRNELVGAEEIVKLNQMHVDALRQTLIAILSSNYNQGAMDSAEFNIKSVEANATRDKIEGLKSVLADLTGGNEVTVVTHHYHNFLGRIDHFLAILQKTFQPEINVRAIDAQEVVMSNRDHGLQYGLKRLSLAQAKLVEIPQAIIAGIGQIPVVENILYYSINTFRRLQSKSKTETIN